MIFEHFSASLAAINYITRRFCFKNEQLIPD